MVEGETKGTATMARTTAIIENGHNVYATPGAVAQHGGSLKIYVCNTCGQQVVWVTSKKTGKVYLCNVRHNYHGARYYMGHDIHKRELCEQRQAQ